MQATNSIYNHPPTPKTPTYPPSVPLSVYRELADELQAAQAQLKTLAVKNQQLTQENQLLRQEMTKLIQSCLRLQKLVDFPGQQPNQPHSQAPSTSTEGKNTAPPKAGTKARPRQQVARPRPEGPGKKSQPTSVSTPVMEMMQPTSQPVFIEEQEVRYYAANEPETKEISGWWLIISILLIMLTAFSAGYLVVRPLFEHQSR